MSANTEPIPFAGRAIFQNGMLRIEGRARYPNEFSTATLEPLFDLGGPSPARPAFALVFHRDKEPYCGPDLIGRVVYFSRAAAAWMDLIRVYVTSDLYEDIPVER